MVDGYGVSAFKNIGVHKSAEQIQVFKYIQMQLVLMQQ